MLNTLRTATNLIVHFRWFLFYFKYKFPFSRRNTVGNNRNQMQLANQNFVKVEMSEIDNNSQYIVYTDWMIESEPLTRSAKKQFKVQSHEKEDSLCEQVKYYDFYKRKTRLKAEKAPILFPEKYFVYFLLLFFSFKIGTIPRLNVFLFEGK